MKKLRIQLRSVFYKEGELWISHCLEMDVMGHDKSKMKAFLKMQDAIGIQLASSLRHDNRANIFMPADAKFFEMYMAGKDITIGNVEVQEAATKQGECNPLRFHVEELQAREACFA